MLSQTPYQRQLKFFVLFHFVIILQFVCIARDDYWQIFSQGEANTQRVEEEGEVVLVTEHRTTDGGSREGQVVIRVRHVTYFSHTLHIWHVGLPILALSPLDGPHGPMTNTGKDFFSGG